MLLYMPAQTAAVSKHTKTMIGSTKSTENRPYVSTEACYAHMLYSLCTAVQALVVADGVGRPALMLMLKLANDIIYNILPAVCLVQLQASSKCTAAADSSRK
jgi:hypothetical protein